VKAAGFKGDMASGVDDALKILLDQMRVQKRKHNSINLVGIFSDDFKGDADLNSIKVMLGERIEINSVIPYDNYAKILEAPRAALNVVFEGFEYVGIYMEQKFGLPYVVVNFPYGIEGSKEFVRKVAAALDLTMDEHLGEMEKTTVKKLEMVYGYVHKLYGMPVAVRGDRVRAKGLRSFLQNELGMNAEVFSAGSADNAEDDFEKSVEESNAVIVFGSSYERGLADRLAVPLIRYTYPVFDSISIGNRSYAGFEGTVNLVEELVNVTMTANYRRDGMYGEGLPAKNSLVSDLTIAKSLRTG